MKLKNTDFIDLVDIIPENGSTFDAILSAKLKLFLKENPHYNPEQQLRFYDGKTTVTLYPIIENQKGVMFRGFACKYTGHFNPIVPPLGCWGDEIITKDIVRQDQKVGLYVIQKSTDTESCVLTIPMAFVTQERFLSSKVNMASIKLFPANIPAFDEIVAQMTQAVTEGILYCDNQVAMSGLTVEHRY